jgi:hypothetical protein
MVCYSFRSMFLLKKKLDWADVACFACRRRLQGATFLPRRDGEAAADGLEWWNYWGRHLLIG